MKHTEEQSLEIMCGKINRDGPNGCWLWTGGATSHDYGIMNYGGRTAVKVHRMMYKLANGNIDETLDVLHKCDVPRCVNPDHLFVGDHAANMADKVAKRRAAWGEQIHTCKLSRSQAESILREYRRPAQHISNARELADKYGVNANAISAVVYGRSWPYLDRSRLQIEYQDSTKGEG